MKIMVPVLRNSVVGGLAVMGGLLVSHSAHALPYAYASNQITGLTVTSTAGPVTPTAFSETISDSASFDALPVSAFGNTARSTATPLTITQAFAGPVAPTTTGYTAAGPGTFTGTRANAAIGAGSAISGGVAVSNVAEGSGNSTAAGQSTANDQATFGLTITGTGASVVLTFSDTYALVATTTLPGETSQASIADTFVVTGGGLNFTSAPTPLNQTTGSSNGTPSGAAQGTFTSAFTITTPVLAVGTAYTLSLTSSSTEAVFPGTTPVPEPASLTLLGSALFGIGIWGRRRRG